MSQTSMQSLSSGRELGQGQRTPSQPPPNGRDEPRRYMSKSQRACDLCRSRKSACRVDKLGSPCRLCSSLGRRCTFDSGPVQRAVRKSQRTDHQSQTGIGNAGSTGSEDAMDTGYSGSMDVGGRLGAPPIALQSPINPSHFDYRSLEDWTTATNQLFAEPLLFSQEMLMPAGLEPDVTTLLSQEPIANAISEPYLDFELSPAVSLQDSSSERELIFPESYSLDSIPGNVNMQIMGPTSDQDPHIIQYHRYNAQNMFTYNRVSYRTVTDRESSVQFEYTRSDHTSVRADDRSNTALLDEKTKLEKLISPEAGIRLIQL